MSTGPLMTRPARYDDVPSCTTPLSRGGVQFEEMTLPPASKERALLTASQPAAFMKKASVNSVKLIHGIVPDTVRNWQRRSHLNIPLNRSAERRLGSSGKLAETGRDSARRSALWPDSEVQSAKFGSANSFPVGFASNCSSLIKRWGVSVRNS
jgi:hypothetical protein